MADRLQQSRNSVAILHNGPMNKNEEHQLERVGDDMTLAAFDLPACIVTGQPSAFARFHNHRNRTKIPILSMAVPFGVLLSNPATAETVKIVGLGASTCARFNQEIGGSPHSSVITSPGRRAS